MTIKQFNNIFDFMDCVTSSLKEFEKEFNDFLEYSKNINSPFHFYLFEFKNPITNTYLINCVNLCGTLEECENVFKEDDRIICTINRDFKIENYSIKKA